MLNLLSETEMPKNSILQKKEIDISTLIHADIKGKLCDWRSKNIYFRHVLYSLHKNAELKITYDSDYIQFIYLMEGKGISCTDDTGKNFFSLKKSEFAFFKQHKNQNRIIKYNKSAKIEIGVLNIPEHYFNDLLANSTTLKEAIYPFISYKAFGQNSIGIEIFNCLSKLKQLSFDDKDFDLPYFELKAHELVLLSLYQYSKLHLLEKRPVNPEDYHKMVTISNYLSNNLDQSHSLKKLAELVFTNTTYVKLNFKKAFNQSVFEFLTALRMEKATELLKRKQLSIAEIANYVGYKHATHFSAAFKKFYGILPSAINKLSLAYLFLL